MTRFYKLYSSSNIEGSELENTTTIWLQLDLLAKSFTQPKGIK